MVENIANSSATTELGTNETETIPTMNSIGIDNFSFQLTMEKLNELNYRVGSIN